MRVTRLEVFGFKSFMERLVLPLEGGVTGVVGPNGCGKSNIVDAIRWVLGETRAKSLRGETLEDVIFSGTDKLRPLGLAEVTLTLRASGDNFFADLQHAHDLEVELAEILDSVPVSTDEEPEHEVGQVEAQEDAQVPNGRPHLTVIEGNLDKETRSSLKIEEQVEVKAQDEAATMPTLATRFGWLRNVSEVQVTRRLYRSGESEFFLNRVPCRLRDLKELFRATGIGARANTVVAQGEVARVVSAKPEERRVILEEAAGVLGFREKIAASTRKLEETSQNIARLEDIVKEVSRQVGILKRQAARAKNRQELKDQVHVLERALARDRAIQLKATEQQLRSELKRLEQNEGNQEAYLQRMQAEEQDIRNEMMTLDIQGDSIRLRVDSIREELSNRARQQSDKRSRLSEVQALTISSQHQIEKLFVQKESVLARAADLTKAIEALEEQERELSAQISAANSTDNDQLQQVTEKISSLRTELSNKQLKTREVRDQLIAAQSGLELIEAELRAASPLEHFNEQSSELNLQGDLLINALKVPEQYTKAVQAVLGERAGFLVMENPHDLAKGLASGAISSESYHALGALKAGDAPSISRRFNLELSPISELIEIAPHARSAAQRLFGSVFVAESLSQALHALESAAQHPDAQQFGFSIVTLAGEILTPHSFQAFRSEVGLLQLSNKAHGLRVQIEQLSASQSELDQATALLTQQLSESEQAQKQLLTELQGKKEELAALSSQLGNVRGQLGADRKSVAQLALDADQISAQASELEARLVEFKGAKERLSQELVDAAPQDESELNAEVERLSKEYQAIDQARKTHRDKLSSFASRLSESMQALDKARAELSSKQLDLQRGALELDNLKQRLQSEFDAAECEELLQVSADETLIAESEAIQMRDDLSKLKSRILREGDVDPSSIQRFEEENARLEELTRQRDDLTQAATTLKHTIERLTETSKNRFLEVFNAVAENFSKLIPRLFGGGRGSIALSDPSKPLETGIEINVRPPGKKLKNIDLLSGGEKALSATALIFAMFMERPSPLCVLDEVDAPLDEANLLRFLNMIREMSSRTQFLLITHNKQSMALADNLVGVTMQQPGASKVIMVSLNEAISQVA